MASKNKDRISRVVESAEKHFGKPVEKVTAPGGEGRASYRLHFDDKLVIGTLRPNFRRTHLEAHVLQSLEPHCDDIPICYGVDGEVMFQSDVGGRRLNQEIMNYHGDRRIDKAAEAVAAIFRIQNAARRTDLHEVMPHLGVNEGWISNLVEAVDALAPYSDGISDKFDRDAACERLAWPGQQFVKWDCRSGNAAIGDDDKLRWFDFEYSGMRHGAEDHAWLIGDEAWPLGPELMLDIVKDAYDPELGHKLDDYTEYLSIYVTFHCVQRIKLIIKEAKKRGWLSKTKVRKYDDAGVHPEFAAHICHVGQYYSERSTLTAPLTKNFAGARAVFLHILDDGQKKSA